MDTAQHAETAQLRTLARIDALLVRPSIQYLIAGAGTLLVTLVRLPFEPWLHGQAPFTFYYPVVVAVAWALRLGPTLLAVSLSTLFGWLLVMSPANDRPISALLFLLSTVLLVVLARFAASTRRTVVHALDESERSHVERTRLAAIVASSDDAIVSKDLNGIVLSWNSSAERVFGYRADEIVGQSITRLIPNARRFEEDHILMRLRRGERIDHFETVRVAKDGREVYVSLSVSPIHNASGQVIGASKIARDVTQQRLAERSIAEQRELLRVTLSNIGDAVVTTDAAGIITYMNPVAERLSGVSHDAGKGQAFAAVFQMQDEQGREPIADLYAKLLQAAGTSPITAARVISRQGQTYPVEERVTAIVDANGKQNGMVVCLRDVTERREAEAALAEQRLKAEHEREQLLQSERAARSDAERANRLKDEFLATVSHELRTPLSAILGWSDVLRRNVEDKAATTRGLLVIERNARIQAQLVSDLLDVSRIVSGKIKLDLQLVQLQSVVEQAIETVRSAAEAKHICIESTIDAEVDAVVGDPDRLQQVVWNLLSNAVKFTPDGGTVGVRLERSKQHAGITVYDTGAGITSSFLPHLFDRFRQADSSPSRRHGGLGLGLTIVKQLVELHGGSVTARSEGEGKGATFRVLLPLDLPEVPRAAFGGQLPPSSVPAGPVLIAERLRGLRVLVVEDDVDGRELLERLLNEAGCKVTAVASAREAFVQLGQHPQDLLVSDIGLPDQDGYSLLAELRQLDDPKLAHTPAIALTAFARSQDRARALRAGFQAHLAKPIDPAELLATVTSFAGIVSTKSKTSN